MSSLASRAAVCFGVSAVSRSVGTRALRWLYLLLLTLNLCLRPALAQTDTAAPVVTSIDTPTQGSLVTMLASITGKAVDLGTENASASGVAQVQVRLVRLIDFGFWSGTQWQGNIALPTTLTAGTGADAGKTLWSVPTTSLPQPSDLAAGRYLLLVTATDGAGNVSASQERSFYVGTQDGYAPDMSVTMPVPVSQPTSPGLIEVEPTELATIAGKVWDPVNADGAPVEP